MQSYSLEHARLATRPKARPALVHQARGALAGPEHQAGRATRWRATLAAVAIALLSASAAQAQGVGALQRFGAAGALTPTAGNQREPRLAKLPGGRLLAVWADNAAHPDFSDVHAAIIDAENFTAGPRIVIAATPLDEFEPEVACGATRCVVVWTEYGAYADDRILWQALDLAGVRLGPPLVLSEAARAARWRPTVAIAADGVTAGVMWQEGATLKVLQLDVAATSTLLPQTLSAGPTTALYRPAIAATATHFIATYGEADTTFRQRSVSFPVGGVPSAPQTLLSWPTYYVVPSIAAVADRAIAMVLKPTASVSFGPVDAVTLSAAGAAASGPIAIDGSGGNFGRPVALTTGTGWWVLYAQELPSNGRRVLASRVEGTATTQLGQLLSGPNVQYSFEGSFDAVPADAGTAWLLATDNTFAPNGDLQLSALSLEGGLGLLRTSPLFTSAGEQVMPAVAATPSGFLGAWVERVASADLRVVTQPLASSGAPAGPRQTSAPQTEFAELALGADATGAVLAYSRYLGNELVVEPQRVAFDGQRVSAGPLSFPGEHTYPSGLQVVATPNHTWVLFLAYRAGVTGLYGLRSMRDGGWPDAQPQLLVPGLSGFTDFAAAASATGQLWAFSNDSTLLTARATFDGALIDGLDGGALNVRSVGGLAVASDGTDYLVAWGGSDNGEDTLDVAPVSGTSGRAGARLQWLAPPQPLTWRRRFTRPRLVDDGSRYALTFHTLSRDAGSDVHLTYLDRLGAQLGTANVGGSSEHEHEAALASNGRGRTLVAYSAYAPARFARELRTITVSAVPLGEQCLAADECQQGACVGGRCCLGAGACAPDAGPGDAGPSPSGDAGPSTGDDAGSDDAGSDDAGRADAGSDGGSQALAPRTMRVACGCGAAPRLELAALAALAWATRARRAGASRPSFQARPSAPPSPLGRRATFRGNHPSRAPGR